MHHEATFKRLLYSLGQSHLGFMLESKVLKFMVKISSTVEVNSVYKLGFHFVPGSCKSHGFGGLIRM